MTTADVRSYKAPEADWTRTEGEQYYSAEAVLGGDVLPEVVSAVSGNEMDMLKDHTDYLRQVGELGNQDMLRLAAGRLLLVGLPGLAYSAEQNMRQAAEDLPADVAARARELAGYAGTALTPPAV